MALKLVVDKLEDVPEASRSLYVEKEGKFHLNVEGIEDTAGLKSALQKEREAAKTAAKRLKELEEQFSGIDPAKVREMMAKLENNDEAALLAAGKIDDVIAKRTEKLRSDTEKRLTTAQEAVKAAEARAAKFSQRVLDNHIRAAAAKVGLHAHAIEDALFRGRTMFALNDEGSAIQLAEDGTPVLGKDGKTPFSPAEWLEGMKESAPHWFPNSNSGGGGGGGGKGGKQTKDLSHLPPAARMTAAREMASVK